MYKKIYTLAAFRQEQMEADVRTQDNLKSVDPRKEEVCFHILVNERSFAISNETIFLLGKLQRLLKSISY